MIAYRPLCFGRERLAWQVVRWEDAVVVGRRICVVVGSSCLFVFLVVAMMIGLCSLLMSRCRGRDGGEEASGEYNGELHDSMNLEWWCIVSKGRSSQGMTTTRGSGDISTETITM